MGSFGSKLWTDCKNDGDQDHNDSLDVSLDSLPDLALEQIFSHLTLADRLRCMGVSRAWRRRLKLEMKSLCFSGISSGRIYGKSRWLSGVFTTNFVNSHRFASFFDAYGRTILSNLNHLRLCDLKLNRKNRAAFAPTLNSFDQLQQLDIIRLRFSQTDATNVSLALHLPMLEAIYLADLEGIHSLRLDARCLKRVKLQDCDSLSLHIVHGESVEALLCDQHSGSELIALDELKNLKYLNCYSIAESDSIDSSLLCSLKEIHLHSVYQVERLFAQRQRYGRNDLKIYYRGLPLDRPDDRRIIDLHKLGAKSVVHLAESLSPLADEIAFLSSLRYGQVEAVEPELAIEVLKRFTDLHKMHLDRPVLNVERFLTILQHFGNIAHLKIRSAQPQRLYDQLPGHCAIQKLEICHKILSLNLDFLLQLKDLLFFAVDDSVDAEWILKAFEQLPFLSTFCFSCCGEQIQIRKHCPKLFKVSTMIGKMMPGTSADVPDLNSAICFIMRHTKWKGKMLIE